jgi:hypothetical protein
MMRPVRFRHDPHISSLVDQAQSLEDCFRARGDMLNASLAATARNVFVSIAIGTTRGKR